MMKDVSMVKGEYGDGETVINKIQDFQVLLKSRQGLHISMYRCGALTWSHGGAMMHMSVMISLQLHITF